MEVLVSLDIMRNAFVMLVTLWIRDRAKAYLLDKSALPLDQADLKRAALPKPVVTTVCHQV